MRSILTMVMLASLFLPACNLHRTPDVTSPRQNPTVVGQPDVEPAPRDVGEPRDTRQVEREEIRPVLPKTEPSKSVADATVKTEPSRPIPKKRYRADKLAEAAPVITREMAVGGPMTNRFSMPGGVVAGAPVPTPQFHHAPPPEFHTESYRYQAENRFLKVADSPLSTFSADVDTASYANVRRFLSQGQLPPVDAVRIEEMVNYFTYQYPRPKAGEPFGIVLDAAEAPWNPDNRLVRIGIQSQSIDWSQRKPGNLVFLLDVSGSMNSPNKLPLVKQAMKLLTDQLDGRDRVSIAVYAGASGLVLPPTSGANHEQIMQALERLQAGGSTNGGAGIELAYRTAIDNLIEGGNNRVILATDGDFNVGVSSEGALVRLVQEKAKAGVFLTVLGFGMGNYKDSLLEQLADKGNGNYAYIDSFHEARKVFVHQLGGTLQTVAKDVKFQVEFNPAVVEAYRLIGYENRLLRDRDFNDDKVDAGDVGAGHAVTVLYEIVTRGMGEAKEEVDPFKYQQRRAVERRVERGESNEMLTLKVRYKEPDGEHSRLLSRPLVDKGGRLAQADTDFRFAAGVAAWGMLLRDSGHAGNVTPDLVLSLASSALGTDSEGYRAEFVHLVHRSRASLAQDGRRLTDAWHR